MKKRILIVVSTVMVAALSLGLFWTSKSASTQPQPAAAEIPTHLVYRHLFRHVAALKEKGDEIEHAGADATQVRTHFQRKAELNPGQARVLEAIAVQCVQEIKRIDAQAKPIIEAAKARYPGGKVPHGERPAPPPPELRALSEERDNIVLKARERLRSAFGESEFNRFDQFVNTRVARDVHIIAPQDSGQ